MEQRAAQKRDQGERRKVETSHYYASQTYFFARVTWGWLKAMKIGLIITGSRATYSKANKHRKQQQQKGSKVDKVKGNENGIEAFLMLLCPPFPRYTRNKRHWDSSEKVFYCHFPSFHSSIHFVIDSYDVRAAHNTRSSPIIITNFSPLCFLCLE